MVHQRLSSVFRLNIQITDMQIHACNNCSHFIRKLEWFYVEIKCQLDATEVFIADLITCSTCFGHHYAHHQELKSIIQWLLRVVFCAVVFSSSWSGVELRVMRPVCRILVYCSWHFISTY